MSATRLGDAAAQVRDCALAGLDAAAALAMAPGVDAEAAWDVAADFQQVLCDLDGIEEEMKEEDEE